MFRFAILNAFRRKAIAVLAILGTAIGVTLMTILLSISSGMDRQMTEAMGNLAGGIAVYPAEDPLGFYYGSSIALPYEYVEAIEKIEHVRMYDGVPGVTPMVAAPIAKEDADFGQQIGVSLWGLDLERDSQVDGPTSKVVKGRTIQNDNEVVIGRMLYNVGKMNGLDHVKIGGSFDIPLQDETITLTIVGIFEYGNMYDDMTLCTNMATARKMAYGISGTDVNMVFVYAENAEYVEEVEASIKEMFADAEVPVDTMIATDTISDVNDSLSIIHIFLWAVSILAAIAGCISIFIVMLMAVIERKKEFGILKAAGWSNWNIINSVLLQSVTVAMLGSAIGLAIGYVVVRSIAGYLSMDMAVVTWSLVGIIAAFGVVVGAVGGLLPAVRAARVSPIETLRDL